MIPPAIAIRGMMNSTSTNFVDANFPQYCMREMGKRNKPQHLGFLLHNIHLYVCTSPLSGCIQNLKTLGLKAGEKLDWLQSPVTKYLSL